MHDDSYGGKAVVFYRSRWLGWSTIMAGSGSTFGCRVSI
ncbi:hypothetical protein BZL29_3867 [Mycobacterium kansasii]|uniref:Uncharacterized protein n=1 Tax=Mycobacterium kansasii TaxID=1768 RepID=A0A1V3XDX7_MYCKA|nr:hypothetical protein BZL29_3867 [Mycobacterium kansasii]